MHVGHARGAVVGDALARLLAHTNHLVTKEFYINDAGAQVEALAWAVYARYVEALGFAFDESVVPGGLQYRGAYLIPLGEALAREFGDRYAPEGKLAPPEEWMPLFRERAVAAMMEEIREDLRLLGVEHDVFTSEAALARAGRTAEVLAALEAKRLIYEGVLEPPKGHLPEDWEPRPQLLFRSSAFGDVCDRPLRKSDGSATYFANDIAYHADKIARGFEVLIDVWGADHAGYVPRMKAAVAALAGERVRLEVVLCQIVHVLKGGEPVRMSKRAGSYVTLRDLLDEVGRDVVRFFMLTRKSDAQMEFDLDKVLAETKDNPVFYVQYAHARTCSVLRHAREAGSVRTSSGTEAGRSGPTSNPASRPCPHLLGAAACARGGIRCGAGTSRLRPARCPHRSRRTGGDAEAFRLAAARRRRGAGARAAPHRLLSLRSRRGFPPPLESGARAGRAPLHHSRSAGGDRGEARPRRRHRSGLARGDGPDGGDPAGGVALMSSDRFEGGFDDEPLAPRRTSGIDPTTKRLLLLAGGLGGVLMVILAVWGLRGAPSGPPPLITPEPGPVRVKPADPGGLKVDQDAAILEGGTKEGGEKLITPAEKPAPEALAEAATPPQAPGAAPFSPAGQAQSAPASSAPASSSAASTASPGGVPPLPAPATPASPQAVSPAPASSAATSAPGAGAASAPAPAKPKAAELASAASNAAPARAASSHAAGKVAVQLAALPTEEAARAEWERLLARHRDLLGGRHPEILKASRDGRTFFRLRVGGFASTAEAARFCHALIAEGGACAVAAF